MRIIFGLNNFKIRSFSLKELGAEENEESNIRIEARQKYFHFFWIPFFSRGIVWGVRKDKQLYALPAHLQTLVNRSPVAAKVKTPFYTFAGSILIIIAFSIFMIIVRGPEYKQHWSQISSFKAKKAILESQLESLTTKDFITTKKVSEGLNDTTIYLKIEDIKGDEITVTPLDMAASVYGSYHETWQVEDEYTRLAGTLPTVKISHKQLLDAYVKEYQSLVDDRRKQSAHLLNDGSYYVVTEVVRHFGPVVSRRGGHWDKTEITLDLSSEGWPATVRDIKEQTGNGDWSENVNKEVKGRVSHSIAPGLQLKATNFMVDKPYKIQMTIADSTGQLHKYEMAGTKLDYTLKEL